MPFEFQRRAWEEYLSGKSGLIHAPTGVGKTWAAWMGPVIEGLMEGGEGSGKARRDGNGKKIKEAIRVVWVTPLRALASDTTESLIEPVRELGLAWDVQMRTGDSPQSMKRKQRERLPTALVTTPESLTLLLSYADAKEKFATLRCVVVDEWHELMGTKRGVQTELALSRLRAMVPGVRTWGVSATLGNLEEARDVLLGSGAGEAALVSGRMAKELDIRTIVPGDIERFPWAGHLGTRSVREVIEAVKSAGTTLLFTNTRSQAEIWFGRLLTEEPELLGAVAIHHGSMDRAIRAKVETMLAAGKLKCVVCTSSLDLGVDFSPVDQVIQLGSPKGVARLVQRAGRSGHRPGARSKVVCVPTHAFELIEFSAAREAARLGQIEGRSPLERTLDVLSQHVVTAACAGGFIEEELKEEVRSTHAFEALSDAEWEWVMDFVRRGGPALGAYPHFARIKQSEDGRWVVSDDRTARTHRMGIGTITAEPSMTVKFVSGKTLGHIEEGFIARLHVGSKFVLGGKVLEIVRVREMTVYVARARSASGVVPRWDGGRFSLSTQLSSMVRERLEGAIAGKYEDEEMRAVRPLLELQRKWSAIPSREELLIEQVQVGRAHAVFLFPFQGRSTHEGLGTLLAYRVSKRRPMTVTSTVNDYGIGLRADEEMRFSEEEWRELLRPEGLLEDLAACINSSNLARRQFRDIARIAGLIMPGFPGASRPMRHVQASSQMFFDVFEQFDPGNLLLDQARREVLDNQLEIVRLRRALEEAWTKRMVILEMDRLSPMGFPIWAEQLRATTLSSEKWSDMVKKMVVLLEEEDRDEDEKNDAVEGMKDVKNGGRGGARVRSKGVGRLRHG
jgi:ATP-dependent Lhr-like helicase